MDCKFEEKYSQIPDGLKTTLDRVESFRKKFGDLALFYASGIAKHPKNEQIAELLKKVLKADEREIKIALVYGSRKAYSDLDLFAVSSKATCSSNRWLDIQAYSEKEFEYQLSVFDISVTDPILTGNLVCGDEHYLEIVKQRLREQPITKEAIYYNIIHSKQQRILANENKDMPDLFRGGNSYSQTYMKNALALSTGKRILTRRDLLR